MIYIRQFGFRAKHSTNHALISTTEAIKSYIDTGNYVGGVFIDLQKAFDTVNQSILRGRRQSTLDVFNGLCPLRGGGGLSTIR